MRWLRVVVIMITGAALFSSRDANSCGPWFPEYEFTPLHGPIDRAAFRGGQLGVLRPHFYRENLLIAYRYLAGVPLSAEEAAAVYPPAEPPRGPFIIPSGDSPVAKWLAARARIPGAPKVDTIDQYKRLPGKDQFEQFPNCLDAAFDNAVATLSERARRWGSGPQITAWLRGQDEVFANCSGGPAIPTAVAAGTESLLAADRQYQVAAAEFYALQFEKAERDFEAIAANPDSPWRDSGQYLAARAMIREGTLLNRPERLHAAEARLKAIATGSRWQASALGLTDFVHATLDPKARLIELGTEFMRPGLGSKIGQVITDYTHIWDRISEFPTAESEVADWIVSFQSGARPEHMIERWHAQQTDPWLVASLIWAKSDDSSAPELIASARKIGAASRAWPTATYYGIRLQIARGESDAATEWADRALGENASDAVANLLRAERLRLARTWEEFLRYGARKPVGLTLGMGDDAPPTGSIELKVKPATFDADFTRPMNRLTPIELWIRAASSTELPRELQADIAQAGWVRAMLLEDGPAARSLGLRARELRPELSLAVRDYGTQPTRFSAALWMLRLPGLSPEIRAGVGRRTPLGEIDSFRDNWWHFAELVREADSAHDPILDLYPPGPVGPTDFLPRDQRDSGEKESARLRDVAADGVDYLCSSVLDWAKSHPEDARLPEALHLAVRATRYGNDAASRALSRQAFELLHRRYPSTEWAKKTKYWY